MRILFFFLLLAFHFCLAAETVNPAAVSAVEAADKLQLAQSKQWLRLLHYQHTYLGLGPLESIIESPSFYVAPHGRTEPKEELHAFLTQLFTQAPELPEDQALQCRFPARYHFVKESLEGTNIVWPDRACPRFDHWFLTLRGPSISLVYSSYYLNNPSSTFGHTLLRINKAPSAKDGKRYELLDYGFNYAANADKNGNNPVMFALKGLFGGFPGSFTVTPYYYKVREYSNAESRDLWEYELNVSQKTVDYVIQHIWEIGPTYAKYWYLTENCSYHMFTVLEAADPNLDLVSHLKKYVIPTDTVQVAWDTPGFVRDVHFRPSVRSELFTRAKELSPEEKNWAANSVRQQKYLPEINSWPADRRRMALDTAIDDMDYAHPQEVQITDSKESHFKNILLGARAEIQEISPALIVPTPLQEAPHLGHGTRRAGVGYFTDSYFGNGYNFRYKYAYHDFTDPLVGYPEYAKITFFDANLSYLQAFQKLDLNQLVLFEVISMSPYSTFSRSTSWRLSVGLESLINASCVGCHAIAVTGGPGYTFNVSELLHTDFYMGLKGNLYYTSDANGVISDGLLPRWLVGAGPNLTLRTRWSTQLTSVIEAWYKKDYQTSYSEYKEVSLSAQWNPTKTWGLKAAATQRWFENQESIDLLIYY
jgi:hypothetical protein